MCLFVHLFAVNYILADKKSVCIQYLHAEHILHNKWYNFLRVVGNNNIMYLLKLKVNAFPFGDNINIQREKNTEFAIIIVSLKHTAVRSVPATLIT